MTQKSFVWNNGGPGDASISPYSDAEQADIWRGFLGHGAQRANAGVIRGNGQGGAGAASESLFVAATSPVSTSVQVAPGTALVYGTLYSNDATETLAIAANGSGLTRIDSVILRKDYVANTVRLAILQGTPAASPVPPTLTQNVGVTYEIALAHVTVSSPLASISQTNITQVGETVNGTSAVFLDDMLNGTGAPRSMGDVVVLTGAKTFGAGFAGDVRMVGVVAGYIPTGGRGRVQVGGLALVKTDTNPIVGGGLFVGEFAGSFAATPLAVLASVRVFAVTIEAVTNNLALAYLQSPVRYNPLGLYSHNALSAAASLLVSNIPRLSISDNLTYSATLVIEGSLRSSVAAPTDTVLIRPNNDTTPGNYFVENFYVAGSGGAPTLNAIQSLGVGTAGIQALIAGNTAPGGATGDFYIEIPRCAETLVGRKRWRGNNGYSSADSSGNQVIGTLSGFFISGAVAITSLSFVSAAGANLTGHINVYLRT